MQNLQFLFSDVPILCICLLDMYYGEFSREALTIESLSYIFLAKFQLQSVMCICNLCCQNPKEQGITLSLLTISFKRSVGFFKYWSNFLMMTWSISSSVVCLLAEIQSNLSFGIALITAL